MLVTSGVNLEDKRLILGVTVSLGEQELHWRDFLQSLVERGLTGVELIVSDPHVGLQAARKAVFSGIPWQRCQFHLQQNASQYMPRQSMKWAADIRAIFNAPDQAQAEVKLRKAIEKYAHSASRLANWLEGNVPDGLNFFPFWKHIGVEFVQSIVWTECARKYDDEPESCIFPNEASCWRLMSAVLMEISETWETGRIYLSLLRY